MQQSVVFSGMSYVLEEGMLGQGLNGPWPTNWLKWLQLGGEEQNTAGLWGQDSFLLRFAQSRP
jgi:hypothetical protein